jgi:hypothetical protein
MRDRVWILLPLSFAGILSAGMLSAGMLSAVSRDVSAACRVRAEPSRFDYLVLASMADSQHPLSMAGYRPATHQKKPCNSNSTSC